ncbi:MAG TPA: glycosyltransferase family 4 protein [Candidatus Paceibacterota bacterium]|nr:glycosyltransferase family 4 protein [Candidatus Paceibacterota bacterium]
MKVVIATPLYPPEIGGPATYAQILEEGLPARGIEVAVVPFARVRHLPKLVRHVAYFWQVYKAAKGASAVLALDPVSVGLPSAKAAWLRGLPFVVKVVGDYAWEQGRQRFGVTEDLDAFVRNEHVPFPVFVLRTIEKAVALFADRVLVPSYYLKSIMRAWGVRGSRIDVIPNAVPVGKPGTVPESIRSLERPLIVTAGRLVPWKHIDGVIDAVGTLRKTHASARLAIVGDGPDRAELEKRAEKHGIMCEFTGQLSHADTLAVIKAADIFVLNSSYEGFSHLLVEALSLGAAVIATDAGGNDEIIEDGKNGMLVPVGDGSALVAAMEMVLNDPSLAQKVRAQAKASVLQYSPDAMLAATASFLSSL